MLTSYGYDDGQELRQHDAEQYLNCPPDLELSKLTVERALQLSAITAAQPTVLAANQRLLALFAALPTPNDEDDPHFWFEVQTASGSLYLMAANVEGWVQLTFAHPTETALARCMLDAFQTLDAEHRAAVGAVVGKRLGHEQRAAYAGELWISAVEQAAFATLIADKAPNDAEAVEKFRDDWLTD
ncbi:hypothetical protein P3T36_004877 [Kitasatospora sp. MAP12-15]|uniref:hypothetical protein n=1 Tax=unclassified Kitasatospora TaxID=2633591 RepID=UPI002475588C|nr:hypothetical protein [Kitasatospora sp. MAP12-44]MDH6110191.1 hypothetical protein [Kitasatospora sp. MAP12-44]